MALSTPLFPPSLFREKTQLDTSSDEASEATETFSIHMSGHWVYRSIHLITAVFAFFTAACTVSQQFRPYYHRAHLVTAAPALVLQVSSFLLQAAPLLLKYNPCECSTSLITALEALLLHGEPDYYY